MLTPEQTPEGWGSAAEAYERQIVRLTSPFASEALDRLELRPGERLIDIACGPGTASFPAAERGVSVLATDYAPEMVERVRQRLDRNGAAGVDAQVMDGQALDVKDGSFDAAVSVFGFMFFPDQDAGFRELHRVLRDGGRAAVVTWSTPDKVPGVTIQRDALVAAIPDLPPPPGPPPIFSLSDPGDLERRARAAGFSEVAVERVDRPWTFESFEDLWDLHEASPVFESLTDVIGDRADQVRTELFRLTEERFGTPPITVPAEALITVARR